MPGDVVDAGAQQPPVGCDSHAQVAACWRQQSLLCFGSALWSPDFGARPQTTDDWRLLNLLQAGHPSGWEASKASSQAELKAPSSLGIPPMASLPGSLPPRSSRHRSDHHLSRILNLPPPRWFLGNLIAHLHLPSPEAWRHADLQQALAGLHAPSPFGIQFLPSLPTSNLWALRPLYE
eukprot:CAMPEP_0197694072 /NCGR_PEP_ID=MMETSP1338-20131121/113355_1 /TAXON_ID=43686 ORGANISM="Pelagodinium beii, Strain RCC1491" /NCGR_SAMPLE_ID=MMETSP1338 /ASSEMBLY_ACC=CAM_ASM_000754 /LENGTH=177 /DNA_ID=CAMNT_0043276877 /DNA_START=153 /DNA_END=686 /DNA_ORIENTATION=+